MPNLQIKRPYLWVCAAFICGTLLPSVSGIWALYSSEPLLRVINRNLVAISLPEIPFSPLWVTTPIAVILLFWVWYSVRHESSDAQPVKKMPEMTPAELHNRAVRNRAILSGDISRASVFGGMVPVSRRYAIPEDSKDIDLEDLSNKRLGELMEAVGRSARDFRRSVPYNASEENIVSQFHKKIGVKILWVYEEARKRNISDRTIENYFQDQEDFYSKDIEWLSKALIKTGARLSLREDAT